VIKESPQCGESPGAFPRECLLWPSLGSRLCGNSPTREGRPAEGWGCTPKATHSADLDAYDEWVGSEIHGAPECIGWRNGNVRK